MFPKIPNPSQEGDRQFSHIPTGYVVAREWENGWEENGGTDAHVASLSDDEARWMFTGLDHVADTRGPLGAYRALVDFGLTAGQARRVMRLHGVVLP